MPSLSLLELLALGDDLPADWRSLTRAMPDERPLLFRWLEYTRVTPLELALHFFIPLEWHATQGELVVMRWSGYDFGQQVKAERQVVPGHILPYFRLYHLVQGMRIPQPLQVDHPHFHPELRQAG